MITLRLSGPSGRYVGIVGSSAPGILTKGSTPHSARRRTAKSNQQSHSPQVISAMAMSGRSPMRNWYAAVTGTPIQRTRRSLQAPAIFSRRLSSLSSCRPCSSRGFLRRRSRHSQSSDSSVPAERTVGCIARHPPFFPTSLSQVSGFWGLPPALGWTNPQLFRRCGEDIWGGQTSGNGLSGVAPCIENRESGAIAPSHPSRDSLPSSSILREAAGQRSILLGCDCEWERESAPHASTSSTSYGLARLPLTPPQPAGSRLRRTWGSWTTLLAPARLYGVE